MVKDDMSDFESLDTFGCMDNASHQKKRTTMRILDESVLVPTKVHEASLVADDSSLNYWSSEIGHELDVMESNTETMYSLSKYFDTQKSYPFYYQNRCIQCIVDLSDSRPFVNVWHRWDN